MRHTLANLFTWTFVAALVLGTVLFARARSAHWLVPSEAASEPASPTQATYLTASDWLAFGERTYRANCQNCHMADGAGRGMYPPIQQMAAHLNAEGGRDYLLNLTLYGVYTGTYGAPMPPMPELSDAEVAAVTNYILMRFAAKGNEPDAAQFYLPREVAAHRGRQLDEWDIAGLRPRIASARALGRGVRLGITSAPTASRGNN